MSRILVETAFKGNPIQLVMGWDRPLQHCFLQVELDDEQYDSPEFEKVVEMSAATVFQPLTVDDIKEALSTAELPVSEQVFAELALHRDKNAGNEVVRFDKNGQRVQVA